VVEGFWGYDGRSGLESLEAPALVMHGPADRVVPQHAAEETARMLPQAEFASIPGSGHVLLPEKPRECNRRLEQLIARAAAR
jgi:pimeloyl-ACP methyl ester carboxylesterase